MALLYQAQNNYAESLELYKKFLIINIFGEDGKEVVNVYSNMALIYAEQNDCVESLYLYKKSFY